jgi:hypothetical protein
MLSGAQNDEEDERDFLNEAAMLSSLYGARFWWKNWWCSPPSNQFSEYQEAGCRVERSISARGRLQHRKHKDGIYVLCLAPVGLEA